MYVSLVHEYYAVYFHNFMLCYCAKSVHKLIKNKHFKVSIIYFHYVILCYCANNLHELLKTILHSKLP